MRGKKRGSIAIYCDDFDFFAGETASTLKSADSVWVVVAANSGRKKSRVATTKTVCHKLFFLLPFFGVSLTIFAGTTGT